MLWNFSLQFESKNRLKLVPLTASKGYKWWFLIFLLLVSRSYAAMGIDLESHLAEGRKIVLKTKRIYLSDYPDAQNPSIVKVDQGILLVFRYCPDRDQQPWLSKIAVMLLDDNLEPLTQPEILSTRRKFSKTPSQSEDPRVFSYRGRQYVIYNDNMDVFDPSLWDRRDMFIAELYYENNQFQLSGPLKLIHAEKYKQVFWQKNWVPFEWNQKLLLTYSIHPHEIVCPDLTSGTAYPLYKTSPVVEWPYGTLRGSTPPLLVDGEYLAFFHSGIKLTSPVSNQYELWHYFMGAYTFAAEPPFGITAISPNPIVMDGFYTPGPYYKRVIFPGGMVVTGSTLYLAYGKDDTEMWIATIDIAELKKSLIPVK